MEDAAEIVVVRIGHRPGRDDRITTHVGLAARALGADRFVLVGDHAGPLSRIDDVTARFGGPFQTEQAESSIAFLRHWPGRIAHLTMYGLPLENCLDDIQTTIDPSASGLAIVVGAEKVPFEVYEMADWNVAITNQPHSEVAGVAVFLDRISEGRALNTDLSGGTHRVIPQAQGKRLTSTDDDSD